MQDTNADYYEILHVHPSAHPDVIQAAYRRLALLYHPDRNPSPEATDLMAQLNRAYEILTDPEKRAEYDRSREAQGNTPPTPGETASSGSGRPSSGYSPGTESSRGTGTGFFTRGSTKNDVLRIQGPPTDTRVYPGIREVWEYGDIDRVKFNLSTGRVQAWHNLGRTLMIQLVPGPNVTHHDFFTEGDHRDEVARLQGTPSRILVARSLDRETWFYLGLGVSIVDFSFSTGRVKNWKDDSGKLRARRAPSDGRAGSGAAGSQREPRSGGSGVEATDNWIAVARSSIYTVDPINPDYRLQVLLQARTSDLRLSVHWNTEISHFETTTVNWQIDNGPVRSQQWHVSTDGRATFLPDAEITEILLALMDAVTLSVTVYPFGRNPIIALFDVRGFATAVAPVLEAWRQAGSPAPGPQHAVWVVSCSRSWDWLQPPP